MTATKLTRRALGAAAAGAALSVSQSAQAQGDPPRYGGTLISVLPDEPPTLATWLSSSFLTRMIAPQMVEGLLEHDPDMTPKPLLAESFSVSPDGLVYTFKLRQGVTWHDGVAFTSADVVFSANEIWLKHLADAKARWTAVGLQAEAPDSLTVVLRLTKPYVFATSYLSSHFAPIIPKHRFEGTDIPRNPLNTRPIGTGPFRLAEYVRGSHIALQRNPTYWRKDAAGRALPYLDRIVMRIMPDTTARILAMTKRELDYQNYPGFPVEAVESLRAAGLSVGADPVAGGARIQRAYINGRSGPMADVRCRRALYYALDRQLILDRAGYGFGKVSIAPLHQDNPAYADFIDPAGPRYPYDPAQADRLLDEAGFPRRAGGLRYTLRFTLNRGLSQDAAIADLMRDQLRAVGIGLDVQRMDEAARVANAGRRDTDLTMYGGIISGPSPDAIQFGWLSSTRDSGQGMSGFAGINDPVIDQALEVGPQALDPAARAAAWRSFTNRMMDQAYELELFDILIVSAWNPDFVGLPTRVWGPADALTFIWWKRGRAA